MWGDYSEGAAWREHGKGAESDRDGTYRCHAAELVAGWIEKTATGTLTGSVGTRNIGGPGA